MISDQLFGTAIATVLNIVGADPQTNVIMLTDGSKNYLLSKNHLDELEAQSLVEFNPTKKTLKANWRKAGVNSEFVRGDKATATTKVTAADIATRLGI